MGFQSQEQRQFLGLYTKKKGATAPRWSAADMVNMTNEYESLQGRAPTEQINAQSMPQHALFFDRKNKHAEPDYTAQAFNLETQSSTTLEFTVRAYFGVLDLNRHALGTDEDRWFIVSSTGLSTNFGSTTPSGQIEGWAILLKKVTDSGNPRINLEAHWRQDDGAVTDESIVITDFQQYWDDEQDVFCVEFAHEQSSQDFRLRLFKNGSNVAETTVTDAGGGARNIHRVNTLQYLPIGAYRDNVGSYLHRFDGAIGQAEIWDTYAITSSNRWVSYNPDDLDTGLSETLLFLHQPDAGEGFSNLLYGAAGYVTAGDKMEYHPQPPIISGGALSIKRGSWAELDLQPLPPKGTKLGTLTDSTKGWMFILEFSIPQQDIDFINNPPWVATVSLSDLVITVNTPTASNDFDINVRAGTRDSAGLATNTIVLNAANLSFGTTYRIAAVFEPGFEAVTTDADLYLHTGSWASSGSDNAVVGTPRLTDPTGVRRHLWIFGTNDSRDRLLEVDIHSFRLFNNLDPIPADAAAITVLDTYPTDSSTAIGWPAELVTSVDPGDSGFVETETSVDGVVRVVKVRDNYTERVSMVARPKGGLTNWSALAHLTRGKKPQVYGCYPASIERGDKSRNYLDFVVSGGVWQYDLDENVGVWLQHRDFSGSPTAGIRGIDHNQRSFVFGKGFAPVKVYPRGTDRIGLPTPSVVITGDGANEGGGLVSSTDYSYRASIYNSETGQESLLSFTPFEFTTDGSADKFNLVLGSVSSQGAEDWDTIRIYRKGQIDNLYYLELELPRSRSLPPEGPDILFESSLGEVSLLLQQVEEINNDPPPDFSAAWIAKNIMYIGVGGSVQYSRPNFVESFPPTNLWRLDGDNTNPVRAIMVVLGRLMILKDRGIWAAPEDAGETGLEPVQVHNGRGLPSESGWAMADNVLFWLSSDQKVYVTDGQQVEDVSSSTIKQTIRGLTPTQLQSAQVAHDARSNQIWILVTADSGSNRVILVYSYIRRRWLKYEVHADSINSGHDQSISSGEFVVIGHRGHALKLGTTDPPETLNNDAKGLWTTGFISSFQLDDTDAPNPFLKDVDGDVIGVQLDPGSIALTEGLPIICVVGATAYDPTADTTFDYLPIHDEVDARITYTYVSGYRDGGSATTRFLYFGHAVPLQSLQYMTVYLGLQKRSWRSPWIAPQGEDRPHEFYGVTFVVEPQVTLALAGATMFRLFHDHSTTRTKKTYAQGGQIRGRDVTIGQFKRGRRFQWLVLGGLVRGEELNISKAAWRYRVYGPRRRTGA